MPDSINVEGNNGGSYIFIEATSEGMVRLEVGETCIKTVDMEISVTGLACILTRCKDIGFQKMLNDYFDSPGSRGSHEDIALEHDLAVRLRKDKA